MDILFTILLLDVSSCTIDIILGATVSGLLMGIIGYMIGRSSSGSNPPVSPFAGLDACMAQNLVQNYLKSAPNASYTDSANQSAGNVPDATSVWFSIDTILAFTNEIAKTTILPNTQLGIRMYYGRYPQDINDPIWTSPAVSTSLVSRGLSAKNYAGKHTVLMVPTYFDTTGNMNIDFDPWTTNDLTNLPSGAGSDSLIQTAFNSSKDATYKSQLGMKNLCMLNHGEMVPPPDPPQRGIILAAADYALQCGTTFMAVQ